MDLRVNFAFCIFSAAHADYEKKSAYLQYCFSCQFLKKNKIACLLQFVSVKKCLPTAANATFEKKKGLYSGRKKLAYVLPF